jgi:anhydro-N-acetylmuramic acid kinase
MPELYIGLMSGTSMDGIDAALVSLSKRRCRLLGTVSAHYPEELKQRLLQLVRHPEFVAVDELGSLDNWVGECFLKATQELLRVTGTQSADVVAIGSHGQTVRHQPDANRPFSLQIGNPHLIASGSGITTVADFRRRDIALGGQGAPLVPAFHRWLFRKPRQDRVIVNIGGIANLTVLPGDRRKVIGFDSGPGNTLLDAWMRKTLGIEFDVSGELAASGRVIQALLAAALDDSYFRRPPPKSTGLEYFNANWLSALLPAEYPPNEHDMMATLAEITAQSIADAIRTYGGSANEVFVCGGGVHNRHLMTRLTALLEHATVATTAECGLDPDWVEACAFAWLAMRCIQGQPGNLPAVTGARAEAVLGTCFTP